MNVKNSWITFSILLTMLLLDLVLLAGYLALIVLSYDRARAGNLDYYFYILGDTIFTFIFAFILTLTGMVFVIHERLVEAPKKGTEEVVELKDLNSHKYLSIDLIPEDTVREGSEDTVREGCEDIAAVSIGATNPLQGCHANFILHDTPFLSDLQLENAPVLKLSGEATKLKTCRVTVKNNPNIDVSYKPFVSKRFAPLTILSCVAMYVSILLVLLGIISFAWAIVIAQYDRAIPLKFGWTFVLVDFICGILVPFLLLCSVTIAKVVLSYFTGQELSLRSAITPLLGSAHLIEHSDGSVYWLVGGRFKYNLVNNTKHPWIESNCSTWALWLVICIAVMFSFSQFINLTVISEQISSTCIQDFDCFVAIEAFYFEHIICPDGANSTLVVTFLKNNTVSILPEDTVFHCFQYLDFAVDNSLFLALGISYSLYLFGIALFNRIFNAISVLNQIKQSRLWALPFFLLGLFSFLFVVLLYFLTGLHRLLFNIIRVFVLFQLSAYFIVIGVLVLVYSHQDRSREKKYK
ncbi:hypothetical protein LOD99_9470 [Oopsacas minuta]|uniref:Transmembrane protein n=1 Tax=Oopsacas minuta TaxID=111878 RepID=A0AAV7JCC6_9METZ|nr:hypothetical protein LOD99_9466 [Oopsacas minuta]KAI6646119.1 hypothetical protein LOD99_9470 [Oopsacas minuta]